MPVMVTVSPVGGMPWNSPSCVPPAVTRSTTLSPSAIDVLDRFLPVRERRGEHLHHPPVAVAIDGLRRPREVGPVAGREQLLHDGVVVRVHDVFKPAPEQRLVLLE